MDYALAIVFVPSIIMSYIIYQQHQVNMRHMRLRFPWLETSELRLICLIMPIHKVDELEPRYGLSAAVKWPDRYSIIFKAATDLTDLQ